MKKPFITKHAKSSAALVSLGIHAVLIVIALSFVAVTVITKEEKAFEAKPVSRPKMQLKKLQVPINIKKKKVQKPKLRKRIVVQPKMNQTMPDIKMPEISGVKGGLGGGAAGGLGGAGGIGFSMPEFKLFGVKGRGEKIYIILDSSPEMMYDEMGGIPAYTIIKDELVRILEGIPPTALVNVSVYNVWHSYTRFPNMVPATPSNVALIDEWLKPLNGVRAGMGANEYGPGTLGEGGITIGEDFSTEKLKAQRHWYRPAMLAMKQQADTVFLLTGSWGAHWHDVEAQGDNSDWNTSSAGKRYWEAFEKGKKMLAAENKKRAAKGEPPRVLAGRNAIMAAYFPDVPGAPRTVSRYAYTSEDLAEAMLEIRQLHKPDEVRTKSGLRNKKSTDRFSFNVVHFRKVGESGGGNEVALKGVTKLRRGNYQSIAGLEAIKSSVSPAEE
jgi:hypothetical protein